MTSPAARATWPGALSPLVADAVGGRRRDGLVLGVFPTSVYIGLEGPAGVVALLAHDALVLPIGLRLAASSRELSWGLRPGDVVDVGEGRVRLPRADVVAARVQRLARVHPRLPAAPTRVAPLSPGGVWAAGPLDGVGGAQGEPLAGMASELAAAALAGNAVEGLLGRLVGAGAGLTPSGDDAISGVLLRLRAAGELVAVDRIDTALRPLLPRTTAISAALSRAAAQGYAAPRVVALVDLVAQTHRDEPTDYHEPADQRAPSTARSAGPESWQSIGPALERVLAIGHSSGRDLVAGIAGADRALLHHALTGRPSTTTRAQEGILHG